MYEGKDKRLISCKEVPELSTVLRLALILITDNFSSYKVLIDLIIEILTVGYDKEGEIARYLPLDLSCEHNH